MKYIHFLTFYFLITSICFTQNIHSDYISFSHSNTINIDSGVVKIPVVALVNSNRLDRMLSTGLRWGSYGIALGIVGVVVANAVNDLRTDYGLEYIIFPGLFGILGSTGGLAYGVFSNMPDTYNTGKNNFGFHLNFGQTMSAESHRYIGNVGLVFRYANSSPYVPDNYIIYFGEEEVLEKNGDKHSDLRLNKYGVQLRKVGYNRTINFLYGVDLGLSSGSYAYSNEDDLSYFHSGWKNVSSVYFDLIVGVNFNLTKFIH